MRAEIDPDTGRRKPVTSCLHTERRQPVVTTTFTTLHAQISSTGCFYLGSRPSRWVRLGADPDGALKYGWSPDGRPGGHLVVGVALPCSWSSVEQEEIEGFVWSKIAEYVHQEPRAHFNPAAPWGLAGLQTFAQLSVPAPWGFSSTSPYTGRTLQAEVQVSRVVVNWDDGAPQVFGPPDFTGLTGYPTGAARHTYQTKTCPRPGPRCREETGPYRIRTTFGWSGWFEVGDTRHTLRIPDTHTDTEYPVREAVSLVVG